MTHTCCRVRCVHDGCIHNDPPKIDRECGNWAAIIQNCSLRAVRKTRGKEKHLATQLEELMLEVTDKMAKEPDSDSPRALEMFVYGYWRNRISAFVVVNLDIVGGMGEILEGVTTFVAPEPLQRLLGTHFTFTVSESNQTSSSPTSNVYSKADNSNITDEDDTSDEDNFEVHTAGATSANPQVMDVYRGMYWYGRWYCVHCSDRNSFTGGIGEETGLD
ncbi:hypothetical protein QBC35DRAFT_302157 [Podospora australis]|uniref:Uncharacterized protein n=1 Tax=Podospora australis TaxID=1536484 RepID=A0AAN6WQ73_9PEZI|nr:hypothetical protein QBC35DRAFT_302157 [Podospora australis]